VQVVFLYGYRILFIYCTTTKYLFVKVNHNLIYGNLYIEIYSIFYLLKASRVYNTNSLSEPLSQGALFALLDFADLF